MIRGNILRSSDTATDTRHISGDHYAGSVAANTYKNIYIEDNAQYGGIDGVCVVTNATNGLGHLSIVNNRLIDLSNAAVSTAPIGVFRQRRHGGPVLWCSMETRASDRGSPQFDYGHLRSGHGDELHAGKQLCHWHGIGEHTESSFTALASGCIDRC